MNKLLLTLATCVVTLNADFHKNSTEISLNSPHPAASSAEIYEASKQKLQESKRDDFKSLGAIGIATITGAYAIFTYAAEKNELTAPLVAGGIAVTSAAVAWYFDLQGENARVQSAALNTQASMTELEEKIKEKTDKEAHEQWLEEQKIIKKSREQWAEEFYASKVQKWENNDACYQENLEHAHECDCWTDWGN